MLTSVEHEIFVAYRYENANNSWHFQIAFSHLLAEMFVRSVMFSIVSNLRFISWMNLMLS